MIRLLEPGLAPAIVWLVTYLVHSTLWVGGAWLLSARLPALPARARSLIWRMALVAPLVTAALQVGAGAAWSVGSVRLVAEGTAKIEPVVLEVAVPPAAELGAIEIGSSTSASTTEERSPLTIALAIAIAIALFRLGLLVRAALHLRREMGPRRAVSDRRLRRLFARLRA
ncbi:MAG TPA: hypothetical protein VN914_03805, partial [Polyangia bacterium]|nr:hypothetical protein [Polyangia bacterium]